MEKRKIIWYSNEEITELEKRRGGWHRHYFAEDNEENGYYWFVVESEEWGTKMFKYYLGVEDRYDDERCNHIFWFSTNWIDENRPQYRPFETPQAVRDYIKEHNFIYKV